MIFFLTDRERRWQSKLSIPAKPNFRKHIKLYRGDLSHYTGLVTGHCPRNHNKKMVMKNLLSAECYENEETSLHILCKHETMLYQRVLYFEISQWSQREYYKYPGKVLEFVIQHHHLIDKNDKVHYIKLGLL